MADREFLLERYKYILEQKRSLNKATFDIAALYQAGLGIVSSAQFTLIVLVRESKISIALGKQGTLSLFALFSILTVFSVSMLVGGISSWYGYRKDEADVELEVHGATRPQPKLADVFGWYETYIALAIVAVYVAAIILLSSTLMPYFQSSPQAAIKQPVIANSVVQNNDESDKKSISTKVGDK